MYALILAGGHSRRMGRDKAWLCYHEQPQWQHLHGLVSPLVEKTYLSLRADQVAQFPADRPHLVDVQSEIGPIGGLLTAWQHHPAGPWLTLACDLPWLDRATLSYLLQAYDTTQAITAFRSPEDGEPEPLIAIWGPGSRSGLLAAAASERYSLRRLMRQLPLKLIDAPDPQALRNVNRPEDYSASGRP
jgi:molybdenum cofactor guanylyltransferase